jgi:protein tyrosine phosphatase (PTP) superfamily phosphohydrolase (DUF442 family)
MKSFSLLFIFSFIAFQAFAQVHKVKTDTVEVIQDYKYLYRYQNFYLSGQPTYETLVWLKDKGIRTIINLRTEKENSEFASSAFNEENLSRELGFTYYNLPIDVTKDYNPEKLNAFSDLLTRNEIILIHCASAGRVTDFFMAYLITKQGYTLDEATAVGRKLRFSLSLEKLLGAEIGLVIKE